MSEKIKLGRKELYELGRKGPHYRFINFPVDFHVIAIIAIKESVKECICSSKDLFDFGCRCGFLRKNNE